MNHPPLQSGPRPDYRDPNALYFVPLGGAGEIGMNLNVYGYQGDWLIIDCGVTFGDDSQPGLEVVMPDPGFIVERRDRLLGIVATHAHEDHIGAIPYLWRQLRCPIWATPFTASFLRAKLAETGFADQVKIHVVPLSGRFTIGPFDLELITLTHSIPEPNAVALRTPVGTVLHTGDWKFDPDPLIGPTADEAALRRLGDEGVLALVGDSTNALRPGTSGSEAELRRSLIDLIGRYDARVAVACFASNVARLETIARAAAAHGREIALVGRSLWRIDKAARENGYLTDLPRFLTEDEAGYIPRDRILMICTGSQGEPRAALSRIARDDHPHVVLETGDVVIFSSRIIPGNEKSINRLQNALVRLGVEIITEEDHFVHVSGHPARDEWDTFYLQNSDLLLRTHTSPVQIRYMRDHRPPIRIIAPGPVYRHEATDAFHEAQLSQVEGLAVDEDIRLSDLIGTIEYFSRSMFGADRRIRISGDHFPFTEPSIGAAVSCGICAGTGCRSCRGGWLEIMGAGMVHPQVLRNGGIDPDRYSGFAFGMGLDRIAMLRYDIADIRSLRESDVRFLRQFG